MDTLNIPWDYNDKRFLPGTVAEMGNSFRVKLSKVRDKEEYRLYLQIRTLKTDGVKDDLKRGIRVATFKKCATLEDAQCRASKWLCRWASDFLKAAI